VRPRLVLNVTRILSALWACSLETLAKSRQPAAFLERPDRSKSPFPAHPIADQGAGKPAKRHRSAR
jgi:hypothetical protein